LLARLARTYPAPRLKRSDYPEKAAAHGREKALEIEPTVLPSWPRLLFARRWLVCFLNDQALKGKASSTDKQAAGLKAGCGYWVAGIMGGGIAFQVLPPKARPILRKDIREEGIQMGPGRKRPKLLGSRVAKGRMRLIRWPRP